MAISDSKWQILIHHSLGWQQNLKVDFWPSDIARNLKFWVCTWWTLLTENHRKSMNIKNLNTVGVLSEPNLRKNKKILLKMRPWQLIIFLWQGMPTGNNFLRNSCQISAWLVSLATFILNLLETSCKKGYAKVASEINPSDRSGRTNHVGNLVSDAICSDAI